MIYVSYRRIRITNQNAGTCIYAGFQHLFYQMALVWFCFRFENEKLHAKSVEKSINRT